MEEIRQDRGGREAIEADRIPSKAAEITPPVEVAQTARKEAGQTPEVDIKKIQMN